MNSKGRTVVAQPRKVSDFQDLMWRVDDGLRAVGFEKRYVFETPVHADAGHLAVACRQDVHLAVAYVYRRVLVGLQGLEGLKHRVGCGFLAHALGLLLADGHAHQRPKIVGTQLLGGRVELVAHHGHPFAGLLQARKHVDDAGIGCRGIETVSQIMLIEGAEYLFKLRMRRATRHRPLDEFAHAVAHERPHFLSPVYRQTEGPHGIVGAGREVVERVEQRAI